MCNLTINVIKTLGWLLLTISLFFSCGSKKEAGTENNSSSPISKPGLVTTQNGTTSIKVETAIAGTVPYSSLFSSIDYRLLSTPSGILVGNVQKIAEVDNHFSCVPVDGTYF